jgi:hypothetical protein
MSSTYFSSPHPHNNNNDKISIPNDSSLPYQSCYGFTPSHHSALVLISVILCSWLKNVVLKKKYGKFLFVFNNARVLEKELCQEEKQKKKGSEMKGKNLYEEIFNQIWKKMNDPKKVLEEYIKIEKI